MLIKLFRNLFPSMIEKDILENLIYMSKRVWLKQARKKELRKSDLMNFLQNFSYLLHSLTKAKKNLASLN